MPNEKYIDLALERFNMKGCNGSNSPKVAKQYEPGDEKLVGEEVAGAYRSSVLTALYLANERTDIQSSVRYLCTRLKEVTVGDVRRLKKLLRYLQATRSMVTKFSGKEVEEKVLMIYADSDWASDPADRRSVSGGLIQAGGCRLYAHSRGQDVVSLSSCEAELYAASEIMKEAILLREMLVFIGMGEYRMMLHVDASSVHSLLHRRGPGKMKHIDVRSLWLQGLVAAGGLFAKKIERSLNAADMLTHAPTAGEVEKFTAMIGMETVDEEEYKRATNRRGASFKVASAGTVGLIFSLIGPVDAKDANFGSDVSEGISYRWIVMLVLVLALLVRGAWAFWQDVQGAFRIELLNRAHDLKDQSAQTEAPAELAQTVGSAGITRVIYRGGVPRKIYVTKTGDCYHHESCRHVRDGRGKMQVPCIQCQTLIAEENFARSVAD
jgi:hypothetical protein